MQRRKQLNKCELGYDKRFLQVRIVNHDLFSFKQMQPYVIRKHRQLSMPAKVIVATVITTSVVLIYRKIIFPVLHRREKQTYRDFAEEYFEKHHLNKDVK